MGYPTNGLNEWLSYAYDNLGQLNYAYTAGQTYFGSLRYDLFGRLTQWMDGSALTHSATYDTTGAANFRLTQLKVTGQSTVMQQFNYATYDVAGNLLQILDYSTPAALPRNTWGYQYDGIGRLTTATRVFTPMSFSYDGLGNLRSYGALAFTPDPNAPHHIGSSTPPGTTPPYQYDLNGALTSRPDTDNTGPDAAKGAITYDADGRVKQVTTGDNHTVRSVYDFHGDRVARIVDEGLATQAITFYYGRWFDVTGGTLTRHMYLGDRLIAESPVAAPSGLTLASVPEAERSILLARAMRDAVATQPGLYPVVALNARVAAGVGGGLLVVCLGLGLLPGRVRVAYFGKVCRGRVGVIVLLFAVTLTPLPLVRPAWAGGGGGGGGPPPLPVYFVSADHLGSTVMLTCYYQSSCTSGSAVRYFRYDPYGQMTAYDANVAPVARGQELTERLYTGQRWDWAAQLYDYGARFL